MLENVISLSRAEPFSRGGNRICYVHPDDPARCLKILNERGDPRVKRRERRFPTNLRPLSAFDENLLESRMLAALWRHYPERVTRHLPRSQGMVQTDLGAAHSVELVRDADGAISRTLEQHLWHGGLDEVANRAIEGFIQDWSAGAPPTREFLPHNLVIQCGADEVKLVLVDGYGRRARSPLAFLGVVPSAETRFERLRLRVRKVLERKARGESPKPRIGALRRHL